MKLVSERLLLRELELGDVTPAYVAWMRNPETNRFLETRHSAQTEDSIRSFVSRVAVAEDEFLFGIFLSDGKHIGNIKVGPIRPIHLVADLSLLIGDTVSRGNGYATEAM